jgi:hypothetical protein
VQVIALEDGIEPEIVRERIAELRTEKQTAQDALAALTPEQIEDEDDYLAERLARVPDLTEQLRAAAPELQSQFFQAFDLRIELDKPAGRVVISACVTEEIANAFEETASLPFTVRAIAGAGFEPATFGL